VAEANALSNSEAADPGPAWFEFGRSLLIRTASRTSPAAAGDSTSQDSNSQEGHDKRVSSAQANLDASLSGDGAFAALAANARLTQAEAEMLALSATAETDVFCQRLVAEIQSDANRNRLGLGTIALIFGADHPGPLTVANGSALRRSAFIEVVPDGPWADHLVAVHPGVIWALLGDAAPDPDLPADISLYETADDALEPGIVDDLVVVNGVDPMRRRQVGAQHAVGERFLCSAAPDDQRAWAALVREATITGRGLIIDIEDTLTPQTQRWLKRATHLSWVISASGGPPIDQLPERAWLEVTAEATEPSDDEWESAFGPDVGRTHHLTFDQMHRVQRARAALGGDIDAAVRRLASGPLEQLTRRISPTRTWDDIILSPDRTRLLHNVVERYRHANQVYDEWGFSPTPSRGLVALFSGPSGTGKTLATEIIAGALGLDVFKLDLSSVVSKYIGETEKNLEQIFDAASAGNMVLFFDEADSLFGKRSEVKDARDRYANIEVSYLLQRLEAYDGLVILATNFERNVDDAFLRRIHIRVEFALPGIDERVAIWQHNLPSGAPVDDVDVNWLAERFELSGGSIRNAAVHAGFAAATAGTPITMESAVIGVAGEYRKLGRLVKAKDFGEYHDLITN